MQKIESMLSETSQRLWRTTNAIKADRMLQSFTLEAFDTLGDESGVELANAIKENTKITSLDSFMTFHSLGRRPQVDVVSDVQRTTSKPLWGISDSFSELTCLKGL
jgi:hypothetical protein